MTAAEQYEVADLRAQLAGLRMILHARKLAMRARGPAGGAAVGALFEPVWAEITNVRLRLRSLNDGLG